MLSTSGLEERPSASSSSNASRGICGIIPRQGLRMRASIIRIPGSSNCYRRRNLLITNPQMRSCSGGIEQFYRAKERCKDTAAINVANENALVASAISAACAYSQYRDALKIDLCWRSSTFEHNNVIEGGERLIALPHYGKQLPQRGAGDGPDALSRPHILPRTTTWEDMSPAGLPAKWPGSCGPRGETHLRLQLAQCLRPVQSLAPPR